MEKTPTQTEFVSKLIGQGIFKDKKQAVIQIARVLGISQTSVYNKLSDRCRFSLEEIILVCTKFQLSIDDLLIPGNKQQDLFTSKQLLSKQEQPNLIYRWIEITSSWASLAGSEPVELRLFPQSFAFQHLYTFPYLTYLILYYQYSAFLSGQVPFHVYSPDTFTEHPAVIQANQNVMSRLKKMTIRELIHPSCLDGLLTAYGELTVSGIIKNLEHHNQIGLELEKMVTLMEKKAEQNQPFGKSASFTLGHHISVFPYAGMADWLLIKTGASTPLVRYQPQFDFATETRDPKMFDRLSAEFEKKWQEANPVSGSGAIVRRLFFLQIRKKAEQEIRKARFSSPYPKVSSLQWHPEPDNKHEARVLYHLPEPL